MNWSKVILAGVVAGIAVWLADYVMHGIMLGNTYKEYSTVFSQEEVNPFWFLAIGVAIAITAAILFAKTRNCWAAGWKGGLTFGFFLGLVSFFPSFYNSLVIADFPYYLGWCWGGIHLIEGLIGGSLLGAIYKRT